MREFLARLFPQFRALESDLEAARDEVRRLNEENMRLQDRLDAAVEDRAKQWALLDTSIKQMAISYQAAVNVQWQQRGFGAPYPDAPSIAPNAVPQIPEDPIVPRRELPSERIARTTSQFMKEMADRLTEKIA